MCCKSRRRNYLFCMFHPAVEGHGRNSTGDFMNKFWKVAALVALAAIPLIIMGKKKPAEKEFLPESGDSSDIFDRELRVD